MESHTFIDTVKLEKANAIAKYRRFRNLAKLVHVIEFLVAFTLISWSSTCLPPVLKLSANYLLQFSLYILNPHVVFLIGNAIVIALFVLSRHIDAATYNSNDIINEEYYLDINGHNRQIMTMEEKRIVCEEEEENVIGETECEAVEQVTKAIEEATKRLQKFQRTQSHKLKRDNLSFRPKIKELRRSETDVGRVVVSSGDQRTTPYETVDKLSNDEFRMTVEAFIEKQLKFLRQQKMAEINY